MISTRAIRRNALLMSVAFTLGLSAVGVSAQDKPADHGSGPSAAYEPSMSTLGQLKVEIPGRKEGDPVMTPEEYAFLYNFLPNDWGDHSAVQLFWFMIGKTFTLYWDSRCYSSILL